LVGGQQEFWREEVMLEDSSIVTTTGRTLVVAHTPATQTEVFWQEEEECLCELLTADTIKEEEMEVSAAVAGGATRTASELVRVLVVLEVVATVL
jgi:hypothetical protein